MQGFVDVPVVWDIAAGVAEVPVKSDGTAPKITMTEIGDIGRFVAAACMLPDGKWQTSMEMVGETTDVDEVTKMIEAVTGKKMERQPVDKLVLQQRADAIGGIGGTRDEMVTKMISQINIATLEEQIGICVLRPTVNQLYSDVNSVSVKVYLAKFWK